MAYYWQPTTDWRYVLKRGMLGFEVAALQVNLDGGDGQPLVVDGDFGAKTKRGVEAWQTEHELAVDGVAGGVTQMSICVSQSGPAAKHYNLPKGLLRSYLASESSGYLGAVSAHPSDGGFDIGPYQMSTFDQPVASQEFYRNAFDVGYTAEQVAEDARYFHDHVPSPVPSQYLTELANNDVEKFKWQMTALSHNWPAAAYYIPRYGHVYTNAAQDDMPASWVYAASGGRLSTPRQWVYFQVEKKTVYVKW